MGRIFLELWLDERGNIVRMPRLRSLLNIFMKEQGLVWKSAMDLVYGVHGPRDMNLGPWWTKSTRRVSK